MSAVLDLPPLDPVGADHCGSCAHWQREDATLGECALGWRAHDGYPRAWHGKEESAWPHGIPAPLTSYHSRCWVEDGWRAKSGAN